MPFLLSALAVLVAAALRRARRRSCRLSRRPEALDLALWLASGSLVGVYAGLETSWWLALPAFAGGLLTATLSVSLLVRLIWATRPLG